jgi:hypothetical protein
MLECALSPLLVRMDDGLGIARGVEDVAGGFELGPQLLVVVDLTVEDEPHGSVFVVDRLLAGRQIDDAQPAHPETDAGFHVDPFVVGTAMPDDVAHAVHQRHIRVAPRGGSEVVPLGVSEACYSTHIFFRASCAHEAGRGQALDAPSVNDYRVTGQIAAHKRKARVGPRLV